MRLECLHDVDINWIIFVYFVVRHRRARQTRGSVLFCTKLQIHITSVSENGGKATARTVEMYILTCKFEETVARNCASFSQSHCLLSILQASRP